MNKEIFDQSFQKTWDKKSDFFLIKIVSLYRSLLDERVQQEISEFAKQEEILFSFLMMIIQFDLSI